ncbi:MAG: hypothetical protein EPO52_00365 [Herbiconiux sp.]|uniref:hypothetical protein n=1 Tax=Herbiconiux sp. TaxID=1871186 RepID=UPI0011F6357A|nr:hypothetical protein [Herbiconiux sp.]TAJ50306.1 MAG: hypothetical protein EPO52_00365 [Herbiconiux sp.]
MSDDVHYTAHLLADEPSGVGPGEITITADDDGKARELLAHRNSAGLYDVWKTDSTKLKESTVGVEYALFEHNMPDPGEAFVIDLA